MTQSELYEAGLKLAAKSEVFKAAAIKNERAYQQTKEYAAMVFTWSRSLKTEMVPEEVKTKVHEFMLSAGV